METLRLFKSLDRDQRNTFVACFLGWALDALDFFLVTFVLAPIGHDFGRTIPKVAFAINREYVKPDALLREGDELALLPPVSGGCE